MLSALRQGFWKAYAMLAMLLGLGGFGLICVGWMPCAALLLLLPHERRIALARRAHAFTFRAYLGFLSIFCGCRFDLRALDQLRQQGAQIVVANHPSLLDAVMILSGMPAGVCIMKAALLRNPLFGLAARVAAYIPNAGPVEMLVHARKELKCGAQLLIFPEGSRTCNFPLDTCLPSAAVLARAAGVPVQVLLIECSSPYLGKAWPLLRPPLLPLHFRIVLGRRFEAVTDVGAMTPALESYLRDELSSRPPNVAGSAGDERTAVD